MQALDQIAIFAEQIEHLAALLIQEQEEAADGKLITLANLIHEKAQAIQAAAEKEIK